VAIKINEKFYPLLEEKTRYYIITGGRGSSKSFSVALLLCSLVINLIQKVLFTRYTMSSAEVSVIPEFTEKIELLGASPLFKVNKKDITNLSGSTIMFRGLKTSSGMQTANLKSLQGVTTWVLDEAEELTDEAVFDKIDLSIRQVGTHNRVILILNPATKEHWIYKRFFLDAGVEPGTNVIKGDVTYIHTTYLDNIKNLSQSYLDRIEQIRINNPFKYKHVIMGGWLDMAEGVIFENWQYGEFDESLPYIYGMDFGFSIDPTTLVKVAIDSKLKRIYVDLKLYETGLSTDKIYQAILKQPKGLIVADSAEPRLISELKAKGVNIEACTKGADSVRAGILTLLDYELVLTESSTKVANELNNYVWSDKKSNTPVDAFNHTIDPIRYVAAKLIKSQHKFKQRVQLVAGR
jgi:phage terminase large subunit